mmetsp:Transcript_9174/g.22898  ORF Transcript_9174/g.22898 Transcript_9174/m.22898 type:complete len:217 (-) Transcript_9174:333-983(-)
MAPDVGDRQGAGQPPAGDVCAAPDTAVCGGVCAGQVGGVGEPVQHPRDVQRLRDDRDAARLVLDRLAEAQHPQLHDALGLFRARLRAALVVDAQEGRAQLRGVDGGLLRDLVHPAVQGPPQRQPDAVPRGAADPHRLRVPSLQLPRRQRGLRKGALQADQRNDRRDGRGAGLLVPRVPRHLVQGVRAGVQAPAKGGGDGGRDVPRQREHAVLREGP